MLHILFQPELQPKINRMSEVQIELVDSINSGAIYQNIELVDEAMDAMEDLLLTISKKNDLLASTIAWGAYMGAAFSMVKRDAPMRIVRWSHFENNSSPVKEEAWE